jgi:GntR family carbon starvation induced transcriptional regulator
MLNGASASERSGKRTMASQLMDSLRNDIVSGTWQPGARLNLRDLSGHYDVGVNPLREALSRLATSGFVSAEDQRGFRVTGISREELIDCQNTRADLECMALRASIERGDVAWESDVLAAHHRMVRSQHTFEGERLSLDAGWEDNHQAFHMTLLSACDSPWRLKFIETLFEHSIRYRKATMVLKRAGARDVQGEHKALMEATLARNADRACEVLRTHFNETTKLVLSGLDEAGGFPAQPLEGAMP